MTAETRELAYSNIIEWRHAGGILVIVLHKCNLTVNRAFLSRLPLGGEGATLVGSPPRVGSSVRGNSHTEEGKKYHLAYV